MKQEKIIYKTSTASQSEIEKHLTKCNNQFMPPLSQKVNIKEYSKKIAVNSITFEAWSGAEIVGLVAAYFNDEKRKLGYITSVSTVKNYEGQGIGKELLSMCIENALSHGLEEILLEVYKENEKAIGLYKKNNFQQTGIKDNMVIMKKILSVRI